MERIPRVMILGGGLAGMAAALCLADAGYEVELLEKRPRLGGRASSLVPPGATESIDNCQHVLLGCCTNLLDFFRRVGTLSDFSFSSSFSFLGPQGFSSIGSSALPAPLHLLPSLLRFGDLAWADCWAIARAMVAILRAGTSPPDEPLRDWLTRRRQTPRAIEHFWRPILTSALNEDLERISTRHAFQVFWESFLKNRRGYRMGVPTVPLGALYASEHLRQISSLRLGATAVRLESCDCRIQNVQLLSGEQCSADFFISALPPDALAKLLPETPAAWPELRQLAEMAWSPITGIHLWFDRPIVSLDHAAVLGRTIQWVFNKSSRNGQPRPRAGVAATEEEPSSHYIQLVISASRPLMNRRRDDILDEALRELRELFPTARHATLQKAVVIREAKATLSFPPGTDALRPGPDTPFTNFFLAGDWTRTGWPPTMEAAVRSGYRAAERVTEVAGKPSRFLQPDLPADWFMRFLAILRFVRQF